MLFERSVQRYSTDNVGLARHGSGLDLVRVGRPKGGEFAFWRYGDVFASRWARNAVWASVGAIAGTVGAYGTLVAGGATLLGLSSLYNFGFVINLARPVVRVRRSRYETFTVRRGNLGKLCVVSHEDGTTELRLDLWGEPSVRITGEEVAPVLLKALPVLNRSGSKADVARAVGEILERGGPDAFAASALAEERWKKWASIRPKPIESAEVGYVASIPVHLRLGLEMALAERREEEALSGEMSALEAAWREAEEIAAIADNLILPENWLAFRDRHREGA